MMLQKGRTEDQFQAAELRDPVGALIIFGIIYFTEAESGKRAVAERVSISLAYGAVGDPLVGDHRHKSLHPLAVSDVSVTPPKGEFVGVFGQMLP